MVYKVDWLQITENSKKNEFLTLENSGFLRFLIGIGYSITNFEPISPRYFYNSGLTLGRYLNLFFDDPNKELTKTSPRNCMFQFTGQGSTDLAIKLGRYYDITDFEKNWHYFFADMQEFNLKFTRLDIALDDFNGVLDFEKIERKLKRREFRSSKRSYNIVKQSGTDGHAKGETIYLGARKRHQNGYLIRFYDKYAEYKDKGAVVPTQVENMVTGEGTHTWQRYEMELHGSACMNFVSQILEGVTFGYLYKGLMCNAIEFLKVNRKNSNRSFWPVVEWWSDFLEDVEKCSVAEPERDLDLGRLLRWLRVAVAPSLHLLADVGAERGFNIYDLLQSVSVPPLAKKQERLKREALNMDQDVLDAYIKQFKLGDYDVS